MADDSRREIRQCPTRADGGDPLIVHGISPALCSERQRQRYHKCPSCVHAQGAANGHVVANGRPALPPLLHAPSVSAPGRGRELEAPRRNTAMPSAG